MNNINFDEWKDFCEYTKILTKEPKKTYENLAIKGACQLLENELEYLKEYKINKNNTTKYHQGVSFREFCCHIMIISNCVKTIYINIFRNEKNKFKDELNNFKNYEIKIEEFKINNKKYTKYGDLISDFRAIIIAHPINNDRKVFCDDIFYSNEQFKRLCSNSTYDCLKYGDVDLNLLVPNPRKVRQNVAISLNDCITLINNFIKMINIEEIRNFVKKIK